ncbi:MAG: cytidine deaminase [Clostridia bacterium]|nr:cytidine deaminase [Clostridia bacterium]
MPIELQWEIPAPDDLTSIEALLGRVAEACFHTEGIQGAGFAIRITDDGGIRSLNRLMRGIDRETDVLSFPTVDYPAGKTAAGCPKRLRREYDPYLGCVNLGDCVINLDRARQQAAEYGHPLSRELSYLTAHSAFHLMGYDHMKEDEKAVMRDMEERALASVGMTRDAEPVDFDGLFAQACEAMQRAYAPYSRFQVGACILAGDGRTFQGCNFENASYGATICAERCAAGNAIVHGARRFRAIAVVGSTAVAWPCGICRQVLREFSDASMPVIVGAFGKGYEVRTLGELLPEALTPEDLGVDVGTQSNDH